MDKRPTRLTLAELEAFQRKKPSRYGNKARYFCPVHGSDNQQSLVVDLDKGHWKCFACGNYGYLPEIQKGKSSQRNVQYDAVESDDWLADAERQLADQFSKSKSAGTPQLNYADLLGTMQQSLPDSVGESYLKERGIPLEVAQAYGVGYAQPSVWPGRHWGNGRVVFPHQTPDGQIVNLYGRAVGYDGRIPKGLKHDHLPGQKATFNASALHADTVYICEAAFDAMSLIVSGYSNACAIYGVNGLRWEWVQSRRIVLCLDNDDAGQREWQSIAWQAKMRGKEVYYLPNEVYHGFKDLNEVLINRGSIDLGEWITQEEQDFTPGALQKEVDPDKVDLTALAREWDDRIAHRMLARHDLSANKVMLLKKDSKRTIDYWEILNGFDLALKLEDPSRLHKVIRELDVFRVSL